MTHHEALHQPRFSISARAKPQSLVQFSQFSSDFPSPNLYVCCRSTFDKKSVSSYFQQKCHCIGKDAGASYDFQVARVCYGVVLKCPQF